jgi:hypothetical protein
VISILLIPIQESSTNGLMSEINRTAIDSSGRLGSLYDGYRDLVLEPLNINDTKLTQQRLGTARCVVTKGTHDQNQNILKTISIEEELRLSILLNLSKKTGTAKTIDYCHSVNEHTRFFLYLYLNREVQLPNDPRKIEVFNQLAMSFSHATHVITKVLFGIDFVVILQLPSDANTVAKIDHVLQKLSVVVINGDSRYRLTVDDENLLGKIVYTTVYSNISDPRGVNTLHSVCNYIEQINNNNTDYAITYTLRPITWLYPQYALKDTTFIHLPAKLNENIEQYVLQLRDDIRKLESSFNENAPKLSSGYRNEQLYNLEKRWSSVNMKYSNEIRRLANLIMDARSGQLQMATMHQILNNHEQLAMKNSIYDLYQYLNDLKEKGHFMTSLNPQHFQYYYAVERDIGAHDNQRNTQFKMNTNDVQRKTKSEQLHRPRSHSPEKHDKKATLRHNNVSPPYRSFQLSHTMGSPSRNNNYEAVKRHMSFVSPPTILKTSTSMAAVRQSYIPFSTDVSIINPPSPSLSVSTDETINILLLGETGVGKSTFINAFANYLTFNTLQEAEIGKPVVLIPVSFLITVGDNFEERIVKFGSSDTSNNEDFDHPGQSVTQLCKLYEFHLNGSIRKKLRIIDTPGFGDTRGLNQDDRNIQHILQYIKKISHLNAVCFLLKPNESRLNISFRSCLAQLFSLLGPIIGNNIIFCFTNSRSTFYTPGNTAPLLKKMLASLPMADVPFKKDNTFCFDSESFRYLVVRQMRVLFSDDDKQEYETSWAMSVTEANRLIHYIHKRMSAYRILTRL